MNLMLLRMRQQHPVVVRALRAALDAEPQAWDGWRTAGTMVAFRPLAPTPWVEEELVRREEERARQDAEREEALTNPDPGVHGESIDDLDDAAAVVARLLSALERIDELERVAGRLPGEVEEAKREAQAGARPRRGRRARGAGRRAPQLERLERPPAAPAPTGPAARPSCSSGSSGWSRRARRGEASTAPSSASSGSRPTRLESRPAPRRA